MKTAAAKKFLVLFIIAIGILGFSLAHAVTISLSIPTQGAVNPCASPTGTGCYPGIYINTFYQFALMIGGLIAFGAIVFGGFKYMTSSGNPSAQSEGKAWIESALLGLLLLIGAYLILNTVNPNLTHLDLPTLQPSQLSGPAGGAGGSY